MRWRSVSAALAGAVVLAGLGFWAYRMRSTSATRVDSSDYADPSVCAGCHAGIAKTYQQTGMGRSFYRLTPKTAVETFGGKPFHQEASDSYFSMLTRDGKYFQRRWQIGPDGGETNVDEKQIDFVIGSGNHARTYLHLTGRNTLQVLPLSWYAEDGGSYAMSPGYDHPDFPGSVRPMHYECIYCHNAYPKIPNGDLSEVTFTPPLPEGIDCQRCHGPGRRHVELAEAAAPAENIRAAIVNPKRLSADREAEVCLQCHLETTSRSLPTTVRNLDRGPFSYVPGQPLGDFRIQFDSAPGTNQGFEIAHAAYRLRESKCFLKSEGQLRCTTCHNPHDIPRGEQAAAHYNGICLNCHSAVTSRADLPAGHKSGASCVTCHMPKRRTDDVVHVIMTDHLIQRQAPAKLLEAKTEKPESLETAYRGEVFPYYPAKLPDTADNSLLIGVAQIRDGSNLQAGLPRLRELVDKHKPANAQYYSELAQGYAFAGNGDQALHYYEVAAQKDPSEVRLVQLGNALLGARRLADAEATLRRAISLRPDEPVAWGYLGWVLWQENKAAEARAAIEKGIAIDPDLPELHNNLGSLLWGSGDKASALREFHEALRIQPGVAEWRLNLARVLASEGDKNEARYQFEQSIRLKPALTEAHADYARLLADMNRLGEAAEQAGEVVKAQPDSGAAHELLGSILTDRGKLDDGIRELERAVQLQPDLWRAHYELAMALGGKGDAARAVEQLRIAASGQDPEAKAAAEQVLHRLGQ